jgi:hypothetical protein
VTLKKTTISWCSILICYKLTLLWKVGDLEHSQPTKRSKYKLTTVENQENGNEMFLHGEFEFTKREIYKLFDQHPFMK